MADISNQLGQATSDLSTKFANLAQITETLSSNLQGSATDMAESLQKAADTEKEHNKHVERSLKFRIKEFKIVKATTAAWQKMMPLMNKFQAALSKLTAKVPILNKLGKGGILGAMAAGIGLFVKQLIAVSDMTANISKDTGLIGKNLANVKNQVLKGSAGLQAWGISVKDVGKQASALVDALGNANLVSAKLLDVTSRIAKATGMSAQEAANLSANLIKGFGKTAEQVESFTQNMMHFATTSGVNARKVMRDIANDSNLTAIYLGRGEGYMAKTAILAAKMGKSMAENATSTDAFLDIEQAIDHVGKINQLTGANLNAQKMWNMAIKQDTIGIMKELNKAFSTPRGIAMINNAPGLMKQLGSQLGLTIKDMKNMNKTMADFESSQQGASKEQENINKYISEAMTIFEKVKAILAASILPLFNSLGGTLHGDISPALESAQKRAAEIGKKLHEWGQSLSTGYEKLKGWATTAGSIFDSLKAFGLSGTLMAGIATAVAGGALFAVLKALLFRGTRNNPVWVVGMGTGGGGGGRGRGRMGRAYGMARAGGKGVMGAGKTALGVGGQMASRSMGKMTGGGGFMGLLKNASKYLKPKMLLKGLKRLPVIGWIIGIVSVITDVIDALKTGNWLKIIPSIMGILGGALGAAGGTALLPGFGTVAGGIGGSMAGEAIGNWLIGAKKGMVVNSPSLFMAGEEGLPEMIVPTGRIARGMPIDKGVADNLGAMGVPGFAMGQVGTVGAAAVAAESTAVRRRAQQQAVLGSQGDPQAIKRAEQKIEQQAAQDRAAQRKLVNDIMKEQQSIAEQSYFVGGPGGTTGPGGGPPGLGPGDRGGKGRDWGKMFHTAAKGLEKFVQKAGGWEKVWKKVPDKITQPLEKAFNKLPEEIQLGLKTGVATAWDEYLKTGNLQDAIAKGAAAGIREGSQAKGGGWAIAGETMAGVLEGKGFRESLGYGIKQSMTDPEGLLNKSMTEWNAQSDKSYSHITQQMKANKDLNAMYMRLGVEGQQLANWKRKDEIVLNEQIKTSMKGAAKNQAMMGGVTAGIDTFMAGGSAKDVIKSGLSGAAGGAAQGAITAGLMATPLAPIAPILGAIGGKLVGAGVSKGLSFLGLGGGGAAKPKPGESRNKIISSLRSGLTGVTGPGDQLFEAYKKGSPKSKQLSEEIDKAISKDGQMSQPLMDDLVQAVSNSVFNATGTRIGSDEVQTLLSALRGAGMTEQEQKGLLNMFERRFEGAGASGAIVRRPTMSLIGEAGPEAVIPLSSTRGNAPLPSGGGDLTKEVKKMNDLLERVILNPPVVNLDGTRVSTILNTVNSDSIRSGA